MAPSTSLAVAKCKPHPNQKKATKFKLKKPQKSSAPRTTAKKLKQPKEDLTLSDWLEVFDYIDTHTVRCQQDVVDYFATRASGAIFFTQSALSKKLQRQAS
ncbi:hypothetical protein PM082_004182 [Marasmius tenuissimus]|nr:hypothetical protein PM082_004182 [Marasmius tenuissimus]